MGLYKFSIAANADISTFETKMKNLITSGANISLNSINDIGNLNFSINEKTVTISYDLTDITENSFFDWYICDTSRYETIIILYNSGKDSESSSGTARYNRIYFNVRNKLVSNPKITETLAAQFNVLKGSFNTYVSEAGKDDVIMLTKCVYNNGANIETGETIVADNLYVSSNLSVVSFKTIVKDENNKQFINVGGFFYLPYSEDIINPSWTPNQLVLPAGTVDYEWNPATVIITENVRWYDKTNTNFLSYYGDLTWNPYYEKNKENFLLNILNSIETAPRGMTLGDSNDKNRVYYIVGKPLSSPNTTTGFLHCYDTNSYIQWGSSRIPNGIMMRREDQIIKIRYGNGMAGSGSGSIDLYQYIDYPEENLIVFAIKASPPSFLGSTYLSELSCYFNGDKKIEYSFQNENYTKKQDRLFTLGNISLKYFAIVDHDQTSDEIISISQKLMDKFGIK